MYMVLVVVILIFTCVWLLLDDVTARKRIGMISLFC